MNDPLYRMKPTDENWAAEFAEEAETLSTAIHQGDAERQARKIRELLHAFHLLGYTRCEACP